MNVEETDKEFLSAMAAFRVRLETGEVDRAFASREDSVLKAIKRLRDAEYLDPEILKLRVTI